MNTAQQTTIEKLRQDYVVTVISDNGLDVKVKASNGISYKFYIIGPRGGKKQQGGGMENGNDLLKVIEG